MSNAGELEQDTDVSFNFWEPKQYMKTVKRLENAHKLSQELSNLVIERAEIEKQYSANLKKWSSKVMISLDTGVEYGTTKTGWSSFSKEADDVSEMHLDIRNKILEDIQSEIKKWQKDHFHKSALPTQQFKEIKAIETEFEYVQKPWCKRLKKSNICKKEYHAACKLEKSLNIQLQNARNDSTINPEQVKKIDEKYKKAEKDVDKTKTSYQASVQDLDGDSGRYMEEMDKIFKKTQTMEQERMEFFKEIFEKIRVILDTSRLPQLKDVYDNFKTGIEEMNCDVDLKNWSNTYGAAMLFQVPAFEEYTPELSGMTTKKKTLYPNNPPGVTLTAMSSTSGDRSPTSKSYESLDDIKKSSHHAELPPTYDESLNPFNMNGGETPDKSQPNNVYSNATTDDEYDTVLVDDKRPGVKVRALYDYKSTEEDELCLKSGDIFERIEEEDEQGWCKGRLNGVIGLYPANYAEPI